ncbi:cob(I)yrinic acid a,c-diamide adenosyltransferase [Caldalkalibacillus salinus]|uniref:cob(I)yrinic acid a,c-diamide adenosyltransferase n=1 Tax=Caldalkalibacillus salinus TaxID=2803787 RepID=UPI001920B8C1|nr:cob(I)yrinic acid a,c-diamide adenosyltransferase [Caldalkalibacillus salinus]
MEPKHIENAQWKDQEVEEPSKSDTQHKTNHQNKISHQQRNEKGKLLVYTGDGKGKTTAALGLALRATGRGKRVVVIQFIKSPQRTYGEHLMFQKIGIDMYQKGAGFTWTKTPDVHREALREAWTFAKDIIKSGEYNLVILDELNNALAINRFPIADVLPFQDVLDTIRTRPRSMDVVVTGRNAQSALLDQADLVTVMSLEKHYYNEGVNAILGLEY